MHAFRGKDSDHISVGEGGAQRSAMVAGVVMPWGSIYGRMKQLSGARISMRTLR